MKTLHPTTRTNAHHYHCSPEDSVNVLNETTANEFGNYSQTLTECRYSAHVTRALKKLFYRETDIHMLEKITDQTQGRHIAEKAQHLFQRIAEHQRLLLRYSW